MQPDHFNGLTPSLSEPRRVLWNRPIVLAFAGFAFFTAIGICLFLMSQRRGVIDPEMTPVFFRFVFFDDYPAAFLSLLLLLVALAPPVQALGFALLRRIGERPARVSAFVTLALAAGSYWVYQAHPLSMDEYAAYFQSQAFAAGKLFGQYPTDLLDWLIYPGFREFFLRISTETGAVGSGYWPGFALLLTPFTIAGVPWLCNPVLGGATVFVVHKLMQRLGGDSVACGGAMLFTVASPAFVINAISFYSMTAHLLCNAIFVLMLLGPTPKRCFFAGLVGGLALTLHNPVPHLLFAAPWLVWIAFRGGATRTLPYLAAGYLPMVMIGGFGWYWALGTLASPSTAGTAPTMFAALAAAIHGLFSVVALPDAYVFYVRMLDLVKLWLWAVPGMLLLGAMGLWWTRGDRRFQLLMASALATFVGFLFVPVDQGHGWGFRYFHSAWFVLPLLAAAPLTLEASRAESKHFLRRQAVVGYVAAAAVASLLVLVPYYLWRTDIFIERHLRQLPVAETGTAKVVMINPGGGYYAQDLVQNDPFLREPVIRMITNGRNADAAMMAQRFPGLVLLERSYRGSVWGYKSTPAPADSARTGIAQTDERKQE